jgi:hypothetical protein
MRAVESQNRQVILLLEFPSHQNPVEIYEKTAEQRTLGKLLIPLALEYNLPDFKLCLRHGADIDARILEAALAGCKLDMTLESFTNIQCGDDDFKKIPISIDMVQELVRHGVNMHAMQDSHENVLIALLIAAADCEGLLELLPKLQRIIGIALQRNDNSASWTAKKIEIIEGSRPLRGRNYLDRQGIANLLDSHQGNLSTNKDQNTARTAATILLGIFHLTSTNHPPDWADQIVGRTQEIENFQLTGNKFFRNGDFGSALESYETGLQVIHDHGVPEHDWTD